MKMNATNSAGSEQQRKQQQNNSDSDEEVEGRGQQRSAADDQHSLPSFSSAATTQRQQQQQQQQQQRHSRDEPQLEEQIISSDTSTTSEEFQQKSRESNQLNTTDSHQYLGRRSISETIDASETLEEFEEREREIARQLRTELNSNDNKEDSSAVFVPDSVQNRQSIEELRQDSFPAESEESDDVPQGYPLGPLVDPPPSYYRNGAHMKMASSQDSQESQSQSPQTTTGYEPPTPPATMYPVSGFAVPSPDDFQPYDPTRLLSTAAKPAASPKLPVTRTYSPTKSNSPSLKSAIGSSFAFAGGMAVAVAGNTPNATTVTSPTLTHSHSLSSSAVYGSDLPSKPPPSNNYAYARTKSERETSPQNPFQYPAKSPDEMGSAAEKSDEDEGYPITDNLREVFEFIENYEGEHIEIEPILKPFLLDFIPAVGDVDPFIKVPRPDNEEDLLGLTVLDEPSAVQSDSALLDLKLHQMSKSVANADAPVKKVGRADKNKAQIERWIASAKELRKSKPMERVNFADGPMPDVEQLMQEWPEDVEQMLRTAMLPSAMLDASLEEFADLCLALVDIPVHGNRRIQSLHLLFSLYSEFKNSQHFRNLAANNIFNSTTPENANNRLEL